LLHIMEEQKMKLKLTRVMLLLIVSASFLAVPVYAHEGEEHAPALGLVEHALSLHEKIDEFIVTAPNQHYFVASLQGRTTADVLLDVREAADYQKNGLEGSVNISLSSLHSQLKTWDKSKKVYVVSDSDIESAYAVFLLRLHGVDAWVAQDATKSPHQHNSH